MDFSVLKNLEQKRKVVISLFSFLMMTVFFVNLIVFPTLQRNQLENYGLLFELIILIVIIYIFVLINFAPMEKKSYVKISLGLTMWSIANVLDVADEIIKQPLWLAMWGEDAFRTIGILIGTSGTFSLIKYASKNFSEIRYLSIIDELTELPNRRYFRQKLSEYENEKICIILIDMDNFKIINDTYGHSEGDKALHKIANILMYLPFSKNNGFSARIGGDEFGICLITDNKKEIQIIVEKFINEVRTSHIKGTALSVSVGISLKKSTDSTHDSMKSADEAMYSSKKKGRNRYEFYMDEPS